VRYGRVHARLVVELRRVHPFSSRDVSDTCHVEDDPLGAGTNNADVFTQRVGSRFLLAPSSHDCRTSTYQRNYNVCSRRVGRRFLLVSLRRFRRMQHDSWSALP
jgi:hypothetical protein